MLYFSRSFYTSVRLTLRVTRLGGLRRISHIFRYTRYFPFYPGPGLSALVNSRVSFATCLFQRS